MHPCYTLAVLLGTIFNMNNVVPNLERSNTFTGYGTIQGTQLSASAAPLLVPFWYSKSNWNKTNTPTTNVLWHPNWVLSAHRLADCYLFAPQMVSTRGTL